MSDILTLDQIIALPSSECQCDVCKGMCTHSRPCWGTPGEIKLLIENGFAKNLMCDYYDGDLDGDNIEHTEIITPALVGHEGSYAPFWPNGRCTFLTDNGLCSIHSLKPVEGRVSDHTDNPQSHNVHKSLVYLWSTKEGESVVDLWRRHND